MKAIAPSTVRRAQQIVADGLPIGPRMLPCVCRAGRHAHKGGAATGGCKATGCQRYRLDVAWDLAYRAVDASATRLGESLREADRRDRHKHYAANPRQPGEWSIGASDTATCPRKIQYRNAPPDDFEPDPEDKRAARMGTIIHTEVTRQMRMLYPWRLFAGRVRIPGLDRDSEYDSYDPITAEVEDYKTAGDWRWDVLGAEGPEESVWEQVMLYGMALIAMGCEVRTVKVSYIKRCNGHDEVFVRAYDPAVAQRALDRLLGYATNLDLGVDLPKTGEGPSTDALCRLCFARSHCWSIPRAEALGRSPESLTALGEAPVDPEVAWAIQSKVESGAERLAAKKREDAAKVLLEGIEPGRYGDYHGYVKWGGGGEDKAAFADTLVELFDLPDGERPAVETIDPPSKPRYAFVQWSKVRKATLEKEARDRAALDKSTT